jgi:Lrp/AsnC family transcriptional regulator for asnA, asnC and gidA
MKLKNEQVVIDGIDKKILRSLISDARTPILEIARNVGISGAAIHQRLRKLKKSGLIAGSKFVINPKVLGYHTMAFIGVFLDKAMSNPKAVKQLEAIPEVIECHYTTGNCLFFLKFCVGTTPI